MYNSSKLAVTPSAPPYDPTELAKDIDELTDQLYDTKELLAETKVELSMSKLESARQRELIDMVVKNLKSQSLIMEAFQQWQIKTMTAIGDIQERMKLLETKKSSVDKSK
jgi:hypothetical protein